MSTNPQDGSRPTVVLLVHGAFADASCWNGVIERLQAEGVRVTAPVNPLRGISHDSAYIASLLEQTPGPVVAVGYSYVGVVITNAAADADKRRRPGLRRRLRPGRRRIPGRYRKQLKGQRAAPSLGRAPVSDETGLGDGRGVCDQARKPPRCERSHLRRRLRYGEQRFVRERRR